MRPTFNHQLSFGVTRPKRRGGWVFMALVSPLVAVVLTHNFMPRGLPRVSGIPATPVATQAPAAALTLGPAAARREPTTRAVDVVVRSRDAVEPNVRQLKSATRDRRVNDGQALSVEREESNVDTAVIAAPVAESSEAGISDQRS
jgi:hypothetical protein